MQSTEFQLNISFVLAILAVAPLFYWMLRRRARFKEPALGFSLLPKFPSAAGKTRIALPQLLLWASFSLFLLALLNPRLLLERPEALNTPQNLEPPTEGIAIYLILDQSGSMTEKVTVSGFSRRKISKIDLVREMTAKFITGDAKMGLPGRPNDLIGLMFFARGAHVEAPLTLDHAAVLEQLKQYSHVTDRNQDGTAIGYAIYKAASLIAATRHYAEDLVKKGQPAYTIKNTIIILLTDGMQDPNPLDKGKRLRNMDVPEAAAYAKSQDVRLYTVNVEPKLAEEEFAPYRHVMQRASESTGGKFYMMDNSTSLEEIYKDIDSLEKSAIPSSIQVIDKESRPDLYRSIPFYPWLVAAGLVCLLSSICLETLWLKQIP